MAVLIAYICISISEVGYRGAGAVIVVADSVVERVGGVLVDIGDSGEAVRAHSYNLSVVCGYIAAAIVYNSVDRACAVVVGAAEQPESCVVIVLIREPRKVILADGDADHLIPVIVIDAEVGIDGARAVVVGAADIVDVLIGAVVGIDNAGEVVVAHGYHCSVLARGFACVGFNRGSGRCRAVLVETAYKP